ncbi:IS256 family transposase [Planococcus sp. PAMC 21323]|nr:IS256 family transposase [Planococcus sp. PAMC 21323]
MYSHHYKPQTISNMTKSLEANPYIFTFYDFPKSIWRSIYSTNLIESFKKNVEKYSKRKEQFPNEDSLERFLVSQFEIYNQNFTPQCHIGFDKARTELAEMFKQA